MKRCGLISFVVMTMILQNAFADEQLESAQVRQLVDSIITVAGGKDELLHRFQIQERLNVSDNPEATPGKPRESVFDGHDHWWHRSGKGVWQKKENEPAVYLVWVWTLQAFLNEKARITMLPEIVDGNETCVGLRISESISPPLDAYFNKDTLQLSRIDWRKDIHRFSDWKKADKATYPARCIGYRKATGKAWYVSQINELKRLEELPNDLTP